jgi:hypothetical protein
MFTFVITFMHGIYNYAPETNHVYRVVSIAAFVRLKFLLHTMLLHTLNMFCNFTLIGGTVVEPLRYIPEGHGINSRWGQ